MTRQTRLFLFVAGAVLVVGLGIGLLASFMGVRLQTLTFLDPERPKELAYVSRGTKVVAFANVRDLMDSELRKKLLQLRPQSLDGRVNDFEAETGISIERDIDSVVASITDRGVEQDRALVMVRGRFDQARIEGLVRQRGGQVEEYKGQQILTRAKDDALSLSFVEADLIALGSADGVRRAIDTKSDAGSNVTTDDELMNLIRDVDDGNAWAVGRFAAIATGLVPDAVSAQLPPIDLFAVTGRVNGGIRGVVRADANSDQGVTDLREVIRGFVALARLQTSQSAELTAMLGSLQLGGEGRTVSLAFSVPPEAIEALAAMWRRGQGQAAN
jgi:hypothetical protein